MHLHLVTSDVRKFAEEETRTLDPWFLLQVSGSNSSAEIKAPKHAAYVLTLRLRLPFAMSAQAAAFPENSRSQREWGQWQQVLHSCLFLIYY